MDGAILCIEFFFGFIIIYYAIHGRRGVYAICTIKKIGGKVFAGT